MKATTFVLVFVLVSASGAVSQEPIQGIDVLIEVVSRKTVELLDLSSKSVLAVYYFTIDGEQSGISDYLINGLSTQIANSGRGRITIVSRQALDRIVDEYSFQMSDLADRNNQIQIGNQIGANLILTGFITPVADYHKVNIQLIEVETGIVRGGFLVDFRLEPDFERRLRSPTASSSEVIRPEEMPVTWSTVATKTTIIETFDTGTSRIPLDHGEDAWGERIVSTTGKIALEEKAGRDGSACARYSFGAKLDSADPFRDWEDSDLSCYLNLRIPQPPGDADGIHLSLKPIGFSSVDFFLKQTTGAQEVYFRSSCSLNSDRLEQGAFEVHDTDRDTYFYSDVAVNPIWTRIHVRFDQLVSEDATLLESAAVLSRPYLSFFFDIPRNALEQSALEGVLDVTLDIDEFILE